MGEAVESVEFVEPRDLGPRDWGVETLLGHLPGFFTFKLLSLKAGFAGGLQFHRKKDEFAYLASGRLVVKYDDGEGNLAETELAPGAVVHFPPGAVHQEIALTDCTIIEVSTPFLNDRVRVEEVYGLPAGNGLPTTEVEDIVEL